MMVKTVSGYDFYECSSAMQKAIRRNDAKVAGYFAIELWESNYWQYVWKRLFTISAEDCFGVITKEVEALWQGYMLVNQGNNTGKQKGRVFISKCVILLCECKKSRDADHLTNLVYDTKIVDVEKYLDDARIERIPIPQYAFDCHTIKGKIAGKTKKDFFKEELQALQPRMKGLFDDLV